ncbi:MAG: SoxR reducing system RseC family protein [Candidatus Zophobacter franzmannii]|jgi:positive regulator of sigma E activity|nr:SoxR reducing system RseC family protein [Candidatus Zophobacter franzmannii]
MSNENSESVGIVLSINNDIAEVEVIAGGGCSTCSMSLVCGSTKKKIKYSARAPFKVKVHDKVSLTLVEGSKVLSALIIFLIPVLFLIFGYIIGTKFGLNEGFSVLVSLGFFGISLIPVKILDNVYGKKINYEITKILPNDTVIEPISCERNEE